MALFFGLRLFFLQVIQSEAYTDLADRQSLNQTTETFKRGEIYFAKRGDLPVPAATSKQEFTVSANPRLINNPAAVYDELNPLLDLNREDFIARMSNDERVFEVVATGLTPALAETIKDLNLRGIFLEKTTKRFYPAGRTASHVLGLLAYQDDQLAGRYGLEKHYEDILAQSESDSLAGFFSEIFLGLGNVILQREKSQGDLVLTIDIVAQNTLEDELTRTFERWQATSAGGIVMDPQTGAILAMAALPDFNASVGVKDINLLPNPLVEKVYEMGSVIKPLTIAAGLDAGVITANTTYFDAGCLVLNTRQICNYDGRARGTVDMQTVLNQSLNTGVIFVSQQLGHRAFADYMLGFGLGEPTGIDLPNEVTSLVSNLKSNRDIEHATASFGQGIALSPIATIRAFATLANGGQLVRPHVVDRIKLEDGQERPTEVRTDPSAIDPSAAAAITAMLVNTVDEALAGGVYKMEHYQVAAKTGTAQMVDNTTGGYYDDRFLHSFFGYFPASEPRFIVFLYLIDPRGAPYASETLSEPFMNNAKFLLNYYEVPPDR